MSNIDKQALREAAEKANPEQYGYYLVDAFTELVTPATVLALLDELEAKEKQIADLKEAFGIALSAAGIDVPAADGKGEAS
ncbi:ead/Ea22-like family protein [Enterobacter kobei]|uniref:ead/Ea22-like family protein n=1 Tax=Enterobacter kobei TaxID=208224 RepID=UPI003D655512